MQARTKKKQKEYGPGAGRRFAPLCLFLLFTFHFPSSDK
jgi:hypothetical protein